MRTSSPDSRQKVNTTVGADAASQEAKFLNEVKQTITEVVQNSPPIVIVTPPGDKKSRKWEIAQITITGLVTALVTFGIWYSQNRFHSLSDEVTAATQTITQAITTRYVLTQEYDKEKFKVYQRAMERLSILENALAGAKYGAASKTNAINAYNSLDDEISRSEFYFSPNILAELQKVIFLTSSAGVINPQGSGQTSAVTTQIAVVKRKIRDEVRAEMAHLPK
jgi:hypothetical protein